MNFPRQFSNFTSLNLIVHYVVPGMCKNISFFFILVSPELLYRTVQVPVYRNFPSVKSATYLPPKSNNCSRPHNILLPPTELSHNGRLRPLIHPLTLLASQSLNSYRLVPVKLHFKHICPSLSAAMRAFKSFFPLF